MREMQTNARQTKKMLLKIKLRINDTLRKNEFDERFVLGQGEVAQLYTADAKCVRTPRIIYTPLH